MSFPQRWAGAPARSPAALALGVAGAGLGLLAAAPAAATAALAAAGYAAGAGLAALARRRRRPRRIDPFTVGERWRGPVKGAMQASARYSRLLASMPPGPLRQRLADIGRSIDQGVEECWQVAQRGHALTSALSTLDATGTRRRLAEAAERGDGDAVVASLEAQLASATRLEEVAEGARQRLVVLEARLHEAVAAAVELGQRVGDAAGAGRLGADVDDVVDQLAALRSALDETDDLDQ